VQLVSSDQADQALYIDLSPPSDSRHFPDSLSKSSGNFPQQIPPIPDPEYILTGGKIGNIHGENRAGLGARTIQSFQRSVLMPDNSGCVFFNGRRLFILSDSSNTSLKNSVGPLLSLPTGTANH